MLLKLRHRMASEESGFTLVELLVVMLITLVCTPASPRPNWP